MRRLSLARGSLGILLASAGPGLTGTTPSIAGCAAANLSSLFCAVFSGESALWEGVLPRSTNA